LVARRGARFTPLLYGGDHERGRRPGTANVPAIVGLGAACEAAARDLATDAPRWTALRDRLESGIVDRVPNVVVHGAGAPRVGNTSHVSFVGAEGEHLVLSLDMKGIAVSAGAACKAGSSRASAVLIAMGVPALVAQSAVRFSAGRDTTDAEIDRVLDVLPGVVAKLRAASPTLAA
jgi:cysteine desulfurase